MLTILYFFLGAVLFTFFTWGMYLSVMNLMRQKDKLTPETKCFAYPLAAVGLLADFVYNITVGTVLFLDLPQELLLTKRLDRYLERDDFRGAMARWFCVHLLDPFDPKGKHCFNKH